MADVKYVETTHVVTNQPPPLEDYDAYGRDATLAGCIEREGASWASERLAAYGRVVGSAETIELGFQANRHEPALCTHDRYGHRIDEVSYHPAYHALMARATEHEVHAIAWRSPGPGAQVAHAALLYLHAQAESGSCCPLTMTHAAVPALRVEPKVASVWEPRILAARYDGRNLEVAQKESATVGMAMTEKQGGSDVRANTTRARPLGARGSGEPYELHGHKWFCSAPMSDAFLTLAQADGGLSCFLVPRWLHGAAIATSMRRSCASSTSLPTRTRRRRMPGSWSRASRSRSRPACWCAMRPRTSPMPTARAGWASCAALPTACCRATWTRVRSSRAPGRSDAPPIAAPGAAGG